MTLIDRRSLIKVAATAGFAAACGTSSKPAASDAQNEAQKPPQSGPKARDPKKIGIQFSGLFACAYSARVREVRMAMPKVNDHTAFAAVDLRNVEVTDGASADPTMVIAGPDGQEIGLWQINPGGQQMEFPDAATTEPIKPAATSKDGPCPGNDPEKWKSIAWLADIGKIQGKPSEKFEPGAYLLLKYGIFGGMMPSHLDYDQKFIVRDDKDEPVLNADKQNIIDQPLANGIFYQVDIKGNSASLNLQKGTTIVVKGETGNPFQVFISNLPHQFVKKGDPVLKRLQHFEHLYGMFFSSFDKRYPGVDGRCGVQRNIRPIYCPPGIVFLA